MMYLLSVVTLVMVVGACGGDGSATGPEETTADSPPPEAAEHGSGGDSRDVSDPEASGVPENDAISPAEMPDLVGLQEDDAIEQLESLGIDDYGFDERVSLTPPGEVVDQLPSAGAQVGGPVTLMIAVPLPPMPDYAGQRVGDVRTELEDWGVTVNDENVLSDDRPSGEVIGTTPAAGAEIGSEVVLEIAVAPVVGLPGTEVTEVEKGDDGLAHPAEGSVGINGELYERSYYVMEYDVDPGDFAYWEYNLGRDWESFEGVVGLLDDYSNAQQSGRFRIILDDSVIWEKDIEFGESAEVSINVSNGLRLRLEAVSLGEGDIGLGWGDARLLGIPGTAPTEEPQSHDE